MNRKKISQKVPEVPGSVKQLLRDIGGFFTAQYTVNYFCEEINCAGRNALFVNVTAPADFAFFKKLCYN